LTNTLNTILANKIVPIIRNANPKDVLKIVKALQEGGVKVVEITLNSPKALKVIEEVADEFGEQMLVGAGTVLDPEGAFSALSAGARFILSPTLNIETIKMTRKYGAVSIPAAYTPTEILTAYENGGDIIKVFPASIGPGYIKDIRGPLPQIPLLPTGGVNLENIGEFMKAGAVGCGIGSSLVNTKLEVTEQYLQELTEKARKFLAAAGANN
jgi:2-dehydro-3-deoxyphosphogluconate aldolase / (4S)-4-hydroxy-2-oxoglutarate aldolase